MRSLLFFTLWAPMASMGDVAVGERRVGNDRPSKSAIVGLFAAALGVERREENAHSDLAAGYGIAVRVNHRGTLIEDYHTVQTPPARKGKRWATRADELAEAHLETVLSLRDYRADVHLTVAVWERERAPYKLERLGAALKRPQFTLYFGRKNCPLGQPPHPQILEAKSLAEGFVFFDCQQTRSTEILQRLFAHEQTKHDRQVYYADTDCRGWLGSGVREHQIVQRRDEVASRRRWQFGIRDELIAVPAATDGENPS